jgi:hypothetical protein
MQDNMRIWNQIKQPPAEALKAIEGGRLKGMTDINPQWRYQTLTTAFGPFGYGWKYEIKELWTETAVEDRVFAFARIDLYVKDGEEWSAPMPGVGGSMMVTKDKWGMYYNDEAYKMAVTDAISVAGKPLGLAADIHLGRWNGSEYTEPANDEQRNKAADWSADLEATDDLMNWWFTHGKQVKADCGTKIAADIYATWQAKKKAASK